MNLSLVCLTVGAKQQKSSIKDSNNKILKDHRDVHGCYFQRGELKNPDPFILRSVICDTG